MTFNNFQKLYDNDDYYGVYEWSSVNHNEKAKILFVKLNDKVREFSHKRKQILILSLIRTQLKLIVIENE
jgi:hypothetical protein